MEFSYYVFFPVRDGEKTIRKVMESLINQSIKPKKIMVVEDGSRDKTSEILEEFEKKFPELIRIEHTDSKTRDFKRIPKLWNICLDEKYDFHMIAAGDCIFANNYAEKILQKFSTDPKLIIASGDFGRKKTKAPHGAGRFVRQSWFFQNYEKYYEKIGYESEILQRVLFQNYHLAVLHDVNFEHVDELGHSHNFSEFGQGMKALGYHPLYVIGRCCSQFFGSKEINKKGVLNMLWKYLSFRPMEDGYYSQWPKEIRQQIRKNQLKTIKNYLKKNKSK
jgi:glycosyltransferase involved in cell wall biosynthesis